VGAVARHGRRQGALDRSGWSESKRVGIEWEPAGRTQLRLDGQRRNLQEATGHQVVDISTRRLAADVDSKVGSDPRPLHNILDEMPSHPAHLLET
jgi:hypothetical protein